MTDLRAAWRALISTPLVSMVVVVSLALGMGVNSALFSILDAALLRPLPVAAPERLISIVYGDQPASTLPSRVWQDISGRNLFDTFAWMRLRADTNVGGETRFLDGMAVSGNLFGVLGITPAAGRLLANADDQTGGGPDGLAAVISYGFWHRQFGGADSAIGATLTLDRKPYRIVGVTPRSFTGLHIGVPFEFAVPLETAALPNVRIMARLPADHSADAVTAQLRLIQPLIREATMSPYASASLRASYLQTPLTARVTPGGVSALRTQYEQPLYALIAVAAAVLLVACVNIAAALLAQAGRRRREWAVRAALGASRLRLARQVLVESALLSAAGAVAGLAIAQYAAPRVIRLLSNESTTYLLGIAPDWRVLSFTGAVAIATAMLFGAMPALHAAQIDPIDALKDGTAAGSKKHREVGSGLMAAQLALCLVLIVAAGLFGRTFIALASLDPGFDGDRVLVASVDARRANVSERERLQLYERIREAVAGLRGIEQAAVSLTSPAGDLFDTESLETDDGRLLDAAGQAIASYVIGPGWFEALGTEFRAGRDFNEQDRAGGPSVAIVNETLARRLSASEPVLGRTINVVRALNALEVRRTPVTIVGVTGDAIARDVRETPPPAVFVPLAQVAAQRQLSASADVLVRTPAPHSALLRQGIVEAIADVNPALSITYRTLDDRVNSQIAHNRLLAWSTGVFGALALLLAAVGLYGVTAAATAHRRREIGIRLALGAGRRTIAWLVLRRALTVMIVGIAAGLAASTWLTRFTESILFEIEPGDPATLTAAAIVLAVVTSAAAWWPAHRAARTAPSALLRSDT
jgi:putative ABC transport system permease protein